MANFVSIVVKAVDQTKKGLTSPIKNLDDLGKSVKAMGPAFAAMASAGAAAFAAISKAQINTLDKLGKTAGKLGITTERLSTLAHAAKLSGVEQDTLNMALQRFTRRTAEAAQGSGELKGVLDQYGIAVKDASGRNRETTDVLADLADVIQSTEDQSERLRIAFKAFDSEGAALVNLLQKGSEGMAEMEAEARALGLEVKGETAAAAEALNDNLDRMKSAFVGVSRIVLTDMLPVMLQYADAMVKWLVQGDKIPIAAAAISAAFETVRQITVSIIGVFKILGRIMAEQANMVAQVFQGLHAVIKQAMSGIQESYRLTAAAMENALVGNWRRAADLMGEATDSMVDGIAGMPDEAKKQFDLLVQTGTDAAGRLKQEMVDLANAINNAPEITTSAPGAAPGQGAAEDTGGKAVENARKLTDSIHKEWLKLHDKKLELISIETADMMQAAMTQIENEQERTAAMNEIADIFHLKRKELFAQEAELEKQIRDENRLAKLEGFEHDKALLDMELQAVISKLESQKLTEEQFRLAKETAELKHKKKLEKLEQDHAAAKDAINRANLQTTADIFGNLAAAAAAAGKEGFIAWKVFSVAQALVSTYLAATNALAQVPYPLNFAAAAAVTAAGLANVATIAATSPGGGQAHSGLTNVPEDQTLFLQAGERVLSAEQNEDFTDMLESGGPGGPGGAMEITINIDGEPLYRGIGQASRDGRLSIDAKSLK